MLHGKPRVTPCQGDTSSDRLRISIQAQQASCSTQPSQQSTRVPASAEGSIYIDLDRVDH